jgi:WD40 repeat protein
VLKFLSPDLSHDQDWANRFLREVRTLRQIRHKNVVNAGNLEPAEDGTLFFSMEYVDGPDLLEFYRRAPQPFDVALALKLAEGVAEGLGAAHAVGVVHRDIKPENILIALEGNDLVPKIADFGIVATRGDSRLTQSGNTMLTPQFAAPEQWMGKHTDELDGRTDLYALGGLLFELLTGRCAFQAETYHEWAQKHLHSSPPVPSGLRPDLKHWRGLDELVLRLLEKDPADRPANVMEVLWSLNAIDYVAPKIPQAETGIETDASPEPIPANAADSSAARGASQHTHFRNEPLKVWPPIPPPEVRPRAVSVEVPPTRRVGWWIAFAVVLVAVVFAVRQLSVTPVNSRVLSNQNDAITALTIAPNGIDLASASRDNTVQFWNLRNSQPLGTIDDSATAVAFSPDSHMLASGMSDNSINLWDVASGNVLGTMTGHSGTVAAIAFSPDGHSLASASWDQTVKLWDVASSHLLRTLSGHTGRVLSLAYAPDGRTLASAGADGTIRLWDTEQGTELRVLKGHSQAVNSIAISTDGRTLASGSDDRTICLWDLASGQLLHTLRGHNGAVLSVALSPDGRTLASGSSDTTVRLWQVATGRAIRVLTGHKGAVPTVAFNPYGDTVASGSSDKTIRIWEIAAMRQ